MITLRRLLVWHGVVVGLGLTAISGCQTHVMEAGLTLPTGWYLQHQPQYIPPTPEYPLPRELANLQDASARPGLAAPAPLVPGGGQ
jgi:hypothetical protein